MCANFRSFLQHDNTDFGAGLVCTLHQSTGGGQSGRSGADDDNIEFHRFTFGSHGVGVVGKV